MVYEGTRRTTPAPCPGQQVRGAADTAECPLCPQRAADQSVGRPSFSRTSRGQPFHSATKVLPVYCRSSTPTLLDQKPEAVRSRNRLKNATPWLCSGLAFLYQPMSSTTWRRSA